MKVTVRRASPSDVPGIRAVSEAAYAVYVPRIGRRPAPMDADPASSVEAGDVWVAELDGELVGSLVLSHAADHLLLESIAVTPRCQHRGVGAALLARAEQEASGAGLREVRLYTNAAMTENLAYYPRHGYVETRRAVEDGFSRVFFAKRLE